MDTRRRLRTVATDSCDGPRGTYGFTQSEVELGIESLLRLPQDDRVLAERLRPLGIAHRMLDPHAFLDDEHAVDAAMYIIALGRDVVRYWRALPDTKQGADVPNATELVQEFGEPAWRAVEAVWPVIRYLDAVLAVREDPRMTEEAKVTEERHIRSTMPALLFRGEPVDALAIGPLTADFDRELRRALSFPWIIKLRKARDLSLDELVSAVKGIWIERGWKRLVAFKPAKRGSFVAYWQKMMRHFASDYMTTECRGPGETPRTTQASRRKHPHFRDDSSFVGELEARRQHHDVHGMTRTIGELAKEWGRAESAIRLALKRVEKRLGVRAPRLANGRSYALDETWQGWLLEELGAPRDGRISFDELAAEGGDPDLLRRAALELVKQGVLDPGDFEEDHVPRELARALLAPERQQNRRARRR